MKSFRLSNCIRGLSLLAIAATLLGPTMQTQEAEAVLTFGDILNISDNPGFSTSPQIAFSEDGDIFIVWIDDIDGSIDTFFSVMASGDDNFGNPINLSSNSQSSSGVRISASGDKIYIVWSEDNEDILFTNGTLNSDGTASFASPRNLSNSPGDSQNPAIASTESGVYVAWENFGIGSSNPDILFTSSDDQGQTFETPINLSNNTGYSSSGRIAVAGSNIYVAWQDDTVNPGFEQAIVVRGSTDSGINFGTSASVSIPGGFAVLSDIIPVGAETFYIVADETALSADVFFASGTIDLDANIVIGAPKNVSSNEGFSDGSRFAVSNGGTIYVVWKDDASGSNEILLSNSTDGGANFSQAVSLGTGPSGLSSLRIALSGSGDLYVTWVDFAVGGGDVILRARISGNSDFENPQNLSNNGDSSHSPVLAAFDQKLSLAWADESGGNGDILFRTISPADGPASIIIESTSPMTPKWGSIVSISGITNGAETDSVTVEWGDGSSTPDVEISGSGWGPVEHSYNKSDTGTMHIIARLLDSGGAELATSDPEEITIEKHETSLSLNNVHSVIQGDDIIATGVLTDLDDGVPIASGAITFNGTGSLGIPDASTDSGGIYISQGPSPDSVDTLWTVQANYAGDLSYDPSISLMQIFDTADANATMFAVPAGAPSRVELSGFDASIEFDEVTSDGTLFISSCTTPENSRYLSLDLCLVVSTALETPADSFAHMTVSFQNKALPQGRNADEVDIFHETLDGFVDITESRDLEQSTVTARVTDFSTFVVGVANHEPPSEGAIRQQVFVGRNELVFNDVTSKAINFDDLEYSLGSSVAISVADDTANSNASMTETLVANITSSSDNEGIQLILTETGDNTGLFTGSFVVVADSSSSHEKRLHVQEGDTIHGSYLAPTNATLRFTIDEIAEAGLIEVSEFVVDVTPGINTPELIPVGDAYEVRLVDSKLDVSATITVIMSYLNVDLTSADEDGIFEVDFRLMQSESKPQDVTRPEWIDISPPPLSGSFQTPGLDIDEKTITGTTNFMSNFTIAKPLDPGGGGGGLPRPGTGIVLDAVAKVASGSDSGGDSGRGSGGGGEGSRSTTITPTSSGDDVETSVRTDSGIVTVRFESVEVGSGHLRVNTKELLRFEEFFDEVAILSQDNDEHGIVNLDGKTYATVGETFDIIASAVDFEGTVYVTIPYDEYIANAFGGEGGVRFLHYNEILGLWEDKTRSVDQDTNTVIGELDSLSPVTSAIILDDVFTDTDLNNTMLWIKSTDQSISVSDAGRVAFTIDLDNTRSIKQDFIILVQIVDQHDVAQFIDWHAGSLEASGESETSMNWDGLEKGQYNMQILILSALDNPQLLSEVIHTNLLV